MAKTGRSHTASSVVYPTTPTSAGGAAIDGISQEPALGERCSALTPELEEYISYTRDRVVKAEELIREIEARPIQETRSVVWAALLDLLQDIPNSWSLYKNLGITKLIINAVLTQNISEETQGTDKSRNGIPRWGSPLRCLAFISRLVLTPFEGFESYLEAEDGENRKAILSGMNDICTFVRRQPFLDLKDEASVRLRSDLNQFMYLVFMNPKVDLASPRSPDALPLLFRLWESHDLGTVPTKTCFRTLAMIYDGLEDYADEGPLDLTAVTEGSLESLLALLISSLHHLRTDPRWSDEQRVEGCSILLGVLFMAVEAEKRKAEIYALLLEKEVVASVLQTSQLVDELNRTTTEKSFLTDSEFRHIRGLVATFWLDVIRYGQSSKPGQILRDIAEQVNRGLVEFIFSNVANYASFGDLVAELCILVRTHPCLARIMESTVAREIITVKTAFVTIGDGLGHATKGRLMLLPRQLDDAIKRALKDANSQCAKCGQTQATGEVSLMTCGSCRLIRYCSKECQKSDWRGMHQFDCMPRI